MPPLVRLAIYLRDADCAARRARYCVLCALVPVARIDVMRCCHARAGAPASVDLAVLPVSHEVLRDDPIEFDGVVPARDEEEEQQLDNEVD